jgi:hypothetical protein
MAGGLVGSHRGSLRLSETHQEGRVDVVVSLPTDPQSSEAVQPGDRALYHPAENAQAEAVFHASLGDDRADAAVPEQAAVLVVVVGAVGE